MRIKHALYYVALALMISVSALLHTSPVRMADPFHPHVFKKASTQFSLATFVPSLPVVTTTTSPPTTIPPRPVDKHASRNDFKPVVTVPVETNGPDVWHRLASCESSGSLDGVSINLRAYNPQGPFFGAFQFMMGTWHSVGGTGDPRDASWDEQLNRAKINQARSGWHQWPACAHRLGLI